MIVPITIARVRTEIPIGHILSKMGVLRRSGNHEIMVCFVHDDHRPSLDVYADRNYCICRSCGWSADVIGAYQKIEELRGRVLSFVDAVRELADMYHIPVLETPKDPKYAQEIAETKKRTEHAFALHRAVADAYQAHMDQAIGQGESRTTAYAYFQARGLQDKTMQAFNLGGVPHTSNELVEYLTKSGYTLDEIEKYHLFRQDRNRDWQSPIHDRVVYPLQNHMGEFVGFAGRKLPDPTHPETDKIQKYINSKESDIYHKHQLLYGLYQASKAIVAHKHCFIVEGYQDVLAMHQAGVRETVAVCGTALTQDQVRLLRRFNDQAILMLDGDGAGQKAMLAHLKVLLQAGMYVDMVVLPDGQDPDEFILRHLQEHPDASRESLLAAFAEYQHDWLTHCCASLAHCDAKTLRTRQSIIFELLAAIPDRVRQETATKKASSMMDLSLDVILGALHTLSPKRAETPQPLSRVEQSTISQREKAEKDIIRHLVLYGTYRQDVHHADSALVHWTYHTLQDDSIHFTNQILQRMMDTLYTAHQHWLSSAAQREDLCDTPYVLVPALQGSDDKHIATCATRIYDQQMVQELTYGEDAQPSTQEILSSMQQFVQALKKGIAQDRMAALTKEAAELLAAEVVDEKRYREVMEEMRRGIL